MFEGRYTLWGAEHSLFTRKLQALLNHLGLDYEFRPKSQDQAAFVEARVGTHFIPALQTPEGWFLHDTTPIAYFLNAKYRSHPIIPETPVQRIACHLLEDWADEWFGRYAIHSRWCYPENVQAMGPRFLAGLLGKRDGALTEEELARASEIGETARDQFGLRACANRGCGPDQSTAVKKDFDELMRAADAHYGAHAYLLGDRASPGDFTFAGLFKAHLRDDPVPRAWVDACAPDLVERMEQVFHAQGGDEAWIADDALPETLAPFFRHMTAGFHRFLAVSRTALATGEKWCEVDLGNGPVRMRSLKYSERSRCHVRNEIEGLDGVERAAVDRVLGPLGVLDAYLLPPIELP